MPRLKTVLIAIASAQVLGYLFFANISADRNACDKFLQFTERRFANYWNKNVNERIFVSSCGDEFFRDLSRLEDVARSSNPEHTYEKINTMDEYDQVDFMQYFERASYHDDVVETIRLNTDTSETWNCIVFKSCTLRSIPFLYKHVYHDYAYSSTPTDYHAMRYNNLYEASESKYLWFLFGWVEVSGLIGNALG